MMRSFVWILAMVVFGQLAAQKPLLIGTASMFSDMASNIVGDKFVVKCIVPIGYDPHMYEPTPNDAKMLYNAQIILKNELTFEGWLSELIENSGTKAKIVTITEGIEPIRSKLYHNATDPHAWMTARNGLRYIENIRNAVVDFDPANKAFYDHNYEIYRKKLTEIDQYILKKIKEVPAEQRVLITSHDAFQYYGRHYGLQLESVLGTSTEADIMVSDILRLNNVIRKNKVKSVFIESTINPKILNQIATDNQVAIGGSLFADSIGDSLSLAPSYARMLMYNTDCIVRHLKISDYHTPLPTHYGLYSFFGILAIALLSWLLFYRSVLNYQSK